jgi:hypothetical protein
MNNTTVVGENFTKIYNVLSFDEIYHFSVVIWTATVLPISLIGAVVNALIFAVTVTYPPLRKSSSCVLLAHCILLDFFMSFCSNPGAVLASYTGFANLTRKFCRGWGVVRFCSVFVNNWVHCVLAINRLVAVVFPHYYKYFVTKFLMVVAVSFPWLIGLLLSVFPAAEVNMWYAASKSWLIGCVYQPADHPLRIPINALGVYVPCVIIGLSYCTVLIKAKIALRVKVGEARNNLRKRFETSKILFSCFLWYCVCSFVPPLSAIFFSHALSSSPIAQLTLKGLTCVSTAVNPVSLIFHEGTSAFMLNSKRWEKGQTCAEVFVTATDCILLLVDILHLCLKRLS